MASRMYQIKGNVVFGKQPVTEDVNDVWYSSSRGPDGGLRLRDNPFSRQRRGVFTFTPVNHNSAYYLPIAHPWPTKTWPINLGPLEAETYARLRGKLYKGSAALGVTLASWRQSREMIVDRYRQMSLQSDSFEERARRVLERKGRGRNSTLKVRLDKLGSQYLEMVFGWQPLLSDIHAAAATVINAQPAAQRISARVQKYVDITSTSTQWVARIKTQTTGVVRYTRAATVEISNPNLWLRERAGLNNPAAVAWDLVPWSFVVNMFANTGQLVNSVTDYAGLSFPSNSGTRSYDLKTYASISSTDSSAQLSGASSTWTRTKFTVPGDGVSRPPLVLKVPDVNWELAAIAASLFFQKFRRVSSLVLS